MYKKLKYFLFTFLLAICSYLNGADLSYDEVLKSCQPEQATAVQEAFRTICTQDDQKNNLSFTKLQGGMTRAAVYSFNIDNKKYVLRFLDSKQPEYQRHNEINAHKIGYQLQLAPECVFADQNAFLMIIPFIQGHTLSFKDLENPQTIALLGRMIATLHHFDGEYPTRYTLLDRLRIHYEKMVRSGIAYPTGFDESVRDAFNKITTNALVPTHGDLNPSNILIGDHGIYMIDWTTATWDDPFNELGYISLLSNLGKEKEREFLESYFGRQPTADDYSMLEQAKLKAYLTTAAIWLRYSDNDLSIPYSERVAKLDAQLRSDSLKKASEYLKEGKVVDPRTASREEMTSYALSFYKAYLENNK